MEAESARIEHLQLIQGVIDRMARNSFAIKAGSATIVAALLAVAFSSSSTKIAAVSVLPLLILWGLDGYYIRQERLFRCLYDWVRRGQPPIFGGDEYFSMDTNRVKDQVSALLITMFWKTLPVFYLPRLLTQRNPTAEPVARKS